MASENKELIRVRRQRRRGIKRLGTLKLIILQHINTPLVKICRTTLRSFEVLCIHCNTLHFIEERVSNRININGFGNYYLHSGATIIFN